jgi:hypothetical protein
VVESLGSFVVQEGEAGTESTTESTDALLLVQIVFHGFNSSVDEARVKIRSTPVTFVHFDDLLNKASRDGPISSSLSRVLQAGACLLKRR